MVWPHVTVCQRSPKIEEMNHHITSYGIPYHTITASDSITFDIASLFATSHRITSHHIASHRIPSHRIPPIPSHSFTFDIASLFASHPIAPGGVHIASITSHHTGVPGWLPIVPGLHSRCLMPTASCQLTPLPHGALPADAISTHTIVCKLSRPDLPRHIALPYMPLLGPVCDTPNAPRWPPTSTPPHHIPHHRATCPRCPFRRPSFPVDPGLQSRGTENMSTCPSLCTHEHVPVSMHPELNARRP